MSKRKPEFTLWGSDDDEGIGKAAWNGTKMVLGVAVAGLALGLGLSAFGSASS